MAAPALEGKKVAVTGRLATLSHSEFAALVQAHGAVFQSLPTRATTLLVLGLVSEAEPPRGLLLAQRYRAAGYPLLLCSEEEFLLKVDLDARQDQIQGQFTIRQLGRVLGVPELRLRSWARAGLIEPAEIVHRLGLYNFAEAAQAKRLYELVEAGASIQEIRCGLQAIKSWQRSAERQLARLSLLSRRRLVVRMDDGQLAEPSGQLLFDFDDAQREAESLAFESSSPSDQDSADDWFNLAMDAEDVGDFEGARSAYGRAIALDGCDPVLHFNLGNVLYARREFHAAVDSYRTAVQLDPCYAEAWNNLGGALAEIGDCGSAIAAYDRAIMLVPTYADARHNRASVVAEVNAP